MAVSVRIGFLGTGFIARYHRQMLARARVPHVMSAVYDIDRLRAAAFAADTPQAEAPVVATSVEEVLDQVDAVYVCTPTASHPELVGAAVSAGVAVFCEKPLGVDLSAAIRVADMLRGRVHQVGLVLRDSPAFLLLRDRVRAPGSGPALSIVFRDDQYLPVRGIYESTWRADPALAGSGTLLEHSIHDLDLIEWIMGPVDQVCCHTGAHHHLGDIEDLAVVLLRFASGAVGTLVSVWHDVLDRPSQRRVEVFCMDEVVTLAGDLVGPIQWQGAAGEGALADEALQAAVRGAGRPLRNPDEAFLEAVRDGTPGWPDADVALRAHVLVDAAYRSAAHGGVPVSVPPPGAEDPHGLPSP